MHERRFDASQAHRLDAQERLIWLPPAAVIRALAVGAGETVIDIGAGTGYFALPFADAVGDCGRVIAVDAQEGMLEHLRKKIVTHAIANIELVRAEAAATALPAASADLVFLGNVWHELPDRAAALGEAKRILKTGGRIAVLDWRPDVAPDHGPPLEHRLSASSAVGELNAAGFHAASRSNAGRYAWLALAVKEG